MAMGRIISKKISLNKIVNERLSSDTCRLAFTWTITHLDRDGRIHGEPSVLRSTVFPRRKDITDEQMENYIREWAENKLVLWYEAEGEKWLQFSKFRLNQPNLRYERETPSTIPSSEKSKTVENPKRDNIFSGKVPDEVRSDAGVIPEGLPRKGREFKLSEVNLKEENLSKTGVKTPSENQNHKSRDGPLDTNQSGPDGKKLLSPEDIQQEKDRQKRALQEKYPDEFSDEELEVPPFFTEPRARGSP